MTIRKKLEQMIFEGGLFEDQASAAVKHFENGPLGENMRGRMEEDESAYPPN